MKLLPCPFCGDEKPVRRILGYWSKGGGRREGFFVSCYSCLATGPRRESFDDADKAWNERCYIIEGP